MRQVRPTRERSPLLNMLIAVPVLILFLGAGVLLARVAWDWTPETTEYVLGGLLTICGASLGIFALVFGLLAGVAIYRRLQRDATESQRETEWRQAQRWPGQLPAAAPPQLEDGSRGSWYTQGPASYDVWEETEPEPRQWREVR